MQWTDLDPDDRLTYLIGDIVRSDVFLEGESGDVFATIAAASVSPKNKPNNLSRLIKDGKLMLRELTLDGYAREMARRAFIDACAAHFARNSPVHDRWMHQGGMGERWVSMNMLTTRVPEVSATPKNLEQFLACRDNLLWNGWRMRGVSLILPGWLDRPSFGDEIDDDGRRWWTAVAVGKFKVTPGPGLTDVQVDDSIQLPPRWLS